MPLTATPLELAQARLELYENAIRGINAQITETQKELDLLSKQKTAMHRNLLSLHKNAGKTRATAERLEEELKLARPKLRAAIDAAQAAKKAYKSATEASEKARKGKQNARKHLPELNDAKQRAENAFISAIIKYHAQNALVRDLKYRLDGQKTAADALEKDAGITQVKAASMEQYYAAEFRRLGDKIDRQQEVHLKNYQEQRDEVQLEIELLLPELPAIQPVRQYGENAQA